jgi:hypothetical protein
MRRRSVEYCVVALLHECYCYGLELARTLAATGELISSEGTIYLLVSRFRHEGLVEDVLARARPGPAMCLLGARAGVAMSGRMPRPAERRPGQPSQLPAMLFVH